jgi:hypothetical protein
MASLSSAGLTALHSAFAANCRFGATWFASLEFSDIHGRFKDANSGIDDLLALDICERPTDRGDTEIQTQR